MSGEMTVVDKMREFVSGPKAMEQFKAALPNVGITPERFARMALTAFNRDPKLYECSPISVLGCLVQAAQSGLSPSGIGGECYLVPFFSSKKKTMEATFIPGYRGLMKVARNSGHVLTIVAEVVRDSDEFEYSYGTDMRLRHVPSGNESGPVKKVYAYAKMKGGGEQFVVLSFEAVEKVRKSSKSGTYGPWVDNWEEMAKKTAIRRLCKYLPLADEDMRLVEAAALEEAGRDSWRDAATGAEIPAPPEVGAADTVDASPKRGRPRKGPKAPVNPSEVPAMDAEVVEPESEPEVDEPPSNDAIPADDDLDMSDLV